MRESASDVKWSFRWPCFFRGTQMATHGCRRGARDGWMGRRSRVQDCCRCMLRCVSWLMGSGVVLGAGEEGWGGQRGGTLGVVTADGASL